MRIHLNETTMNLLADAIADRVTVRTWDNGNSYDYTGDSTPEDRSAIRSVAMGILLGLNYGDEARSMTGEALRVSLNTAEFILMQSLPCVNTYDTIYNPLRAVMQVWESASAPEQWNNPRVLVSGWASAYIWRRFQAWHGFFSDLMAYEPAECYYPLRSLEEAETTLEAWRADGIAEDLPAQDAGMLFLLWNLYIADHVRIGDIPAPAMN